MKNYKNFENLISKIKKKFKKKKVNLHEPYITKKDELSVISSLRNNQISAYGKTTKVFENKIARLVKNKNILSTVNGSSALHLALKMIGINNSSEVFAPSLTYVSTINAIKYCNSEPIFFEIDKETLSIDLKKFKKFLEKNTVLKNKKCINKKNKKHIKALILVHLNGLCCEIDKLKKILKKFNIILIEDAAEAVGSTYKKKHLGTFGEIGVFSFNGNKIITSGGGGALIFKNKKLYEKAKHFSTNCKIKHQYEYIHDDIGYNYRMPSINAALGLSQLEKLKNYILRKKKIHQFYSKILDSENFELIKPIKFCNSNYWLNTLKIKNNNLHKNKLIKLAFNKNFYLRPLWKPMHYFPQFKKCSKMDLKITEYVYKNYLSLPSSVFLQK
jgi:perosamine synthetase